MSDPLGLFEDENKDPLGLFGAEDQSAFSAAGEAALNFAGNMALTPLAGLRGIGSLITGKGLDKSVEDIGGVMEEAYQPRGERGQKYSENVANVLNLPVEYGGKLGEAIGGNEGRLVGEIAGNFATDLLPVVGGLAARGKVKPKVVPKEISTSTHGLLEEINTPKPEKPVSNLGKETPVDYHATEGLDGQRSLFDIPEEGRMPNPYEAVTGDWRIDENGMPIKADLSMDVQNAQQPLQRNLFGDELPQKHPQENLSTLPQAIDNIPAGVRNRENGKFAPGTTRGDALARLQNEIPAPGELLAAKMAAEPTLFNTATRKQGGGINPDVFVEGFEKIKELANGLKLIATGTGDNLNIRAVTKAGKQVGAAVYDRTNKYDKPAQSDLYAKALGSKQRGTAKELYKFANELGNDVIPSKRLTEGGKAVWNSMEKKGIAVNGKIPFNFKKQGGGVLFGATDNIKKNNSDLHKIRIELDTLSKSFWLDRSISKEEFRLKEQKLQSKILDLEQLNRKWQQMLPSIREDEIHPGFTKIPLGTDVMTTRRGSLERATVRENRQIQYGDTTTWYPRVEFSDGELKRLTSADIKKVFRDPFKGPSRKQSGGVLVPWGDKGKLEKLKSNPVFAENLKHAGNAMIASPEEAVQLANKTSDVKQNAVQKGINQLTKGGIYLKAKVDHPVVHYAVDSFLKADSVSHSLIREKIHNEYLTALRSLDKQEQVDAFTLLNAADLNKTQITPEMLARHGVSEKLATFITKHSSLMNDALVRINEARTAAKKKTIAAREAYSAFNMTGDYRKVAFKPVLDAEGHPVLNADGTVKKQIVGVIGANTKDMGKHSLHNLEKAIEDKDPAVEFGPLIDKSRTRQTSKGTPNEAFTDALKALGEDNPHMKKFLDTLASVAKDDPSHYMGMDQHTLQKKGVWGMEGRKPWLSSEENARAFFENQVRYAEGAFQWGELSKAAKDVNAVIRNEDVVAKHQNAVKLSEDYMYNALGMNPSDIGNGVTSVFNSLFRPLGIGPSIPKAGINMARQIANTWMLSLSPMFLALNAIQPLAAMPGMVAYLRGKGMDSFGIAGYLKAIKTAYNEKSPESLSSMEKGALKYASGNHTYATDMVEHSNQIEKGSSYYTTKVTQSPAAYVETGTRKTVYLTLVHALHDGGLSVKDGLYEQAARFTDMAMNNYSQMEKPPIYSAMGPLGTMAYNLRSFGHNEISRWSMYAREAGSSGNAVPLLTQMATTIAMAGVMGLPFFTQWESLYDTITQQLGSPRSLALDVINTSETLAKHLDSKAMYALSHGLWSLAGADASTRLGLGDVLPNNAADAAFAGGGKLAGMIGSVIDVARQRNEETAQAALYNLAPPIAQGPLDLTMYTKDDLAYSKDPSNLKPMARRNELDKTMKAIGITGINESVQKTKNYHLGQIDKSLNDIRTKALNTIAQDIFRDRSFDQKTMDKYFVDGQGDPAQFEQQVNELATKLNLSPEEYAIMKDSATKSITKARSLQRRLQ